LFGLLMHGGGRLVALARVQNTSERVFADLVR
jgi:hypothetical protein